jgi:hypothetical protein
MANIAARPGMGIDIVDPFSCNGNRFKGTARILPKDALVARVRRPGGAQFTFPADRPRPRHGRDACHKQIADHLVAYDAGATGPGLRNAIQGMTILKHATSDRLLLRRVVPLCRKRDLFEWEPDPGGFQGLADRGNGSIADCEATDAIPSARMLRATRHRKT